ncbi:4-hydroxybenzoate polyprenyltransferase [Hahella sp. CCB-MM4]|uniref:4-hydroxybenzoate octaprenyltransferase n=1 Tax=Hahella sp. (strain CCB-MM4) TaxID=1926491 RepID=UPI000B9A6CE6|nr:4-hydroxybenzoate octaprenyltransferase [Hahella sp. CCB-MM4]OZG75057.1 4-hydroxybenzoate polyprenyltransferase [Hahella sp. CCB-MM4]
MASAPETQIAKPAKAAHWQTYLQLMRVDRPIGIYLVLWPTLWALWAAAKGIPSIKNLVIFTVGTFLMRSAGCVINDFADRRLDGYVERTKNRPLATGKVSSKEALILFVALLGMAFILVLFTNIFTILLAFGGAALASVYPFMKRHTHLPQVVLGAAFAWAIPMAFAAEINTLPEEVWLLYTATVVWTVAYDTMYAMVDRNDDIKIGIKSTAILFGDADKIIVAILQVMTLAILAIVGQRLELGVFYTLGLIVAAVLFVYQQHLIRYRDRDQCFKAFLNNNWVGMAIFIGLVVDYLVLQ